MLTQERLKELLEYTPETGLFTWVASPNRSIVKGTVAGTSSRGYIRVKLDGKQYAAHRLAFLWMEGVLPAKEIDHKNGVRDDNRWDNLRQVSSSTNNRNRHRARSDSAIGIMGVRFDRRYGTYSSRITVDDKQIHLGTFLTSEEASQAYREAKKIYHEEAVCV